MVSEDKKGFKSDTEDGNYIKKDGEAKSSENNSQKSAESIFEELKTELGKAVKKLEECLNQIRPIRKQERELDKEIGGVEIDYQKEKELADNDIDIWDEEGKKKHISSLSPMEGDDFETSANQSFIHSKKRGKGKKKGHLGPMLLNDEDKPTDKKPATIKTKDGKVIEVKPHKESMIDKLKRFKLDREHENEDGGMMR